MIPVVRLNRPVGQNVDAETLKAARELLAAHPRWKQVDLMDVATEKNGSAVLIGRDWNQGGRICFIRLNEMFRRKSWLRRAMERLGLAKRSNGHEQLGLNTTAS